MSEQGASPRLFREGDVVRIDAAGGLETTVLYNQDKDSVAVTIESLPWAYHPSSWVRADSLTLVRAVDAPAVPLCDPMCADARHDHDVTTTASAPRRMQANTSSTYHHDVEHDERVTCDVMACVPVEPAPPVESLRAVIERMHQASCSPTPMVWDALLAIADRIDAGGAR